jgi:hypothetical protein
MSSDNYTPVANLSTIGTPYTINDVVTLNAQNAVNYNGLRTGLTYLYEVITKPYGATTPVPGLCANPQYALLNVYMCFTAKVAGTYTIRLTITNGFNLSSSATTTFTVAGITTTTIPRLRDQVNFACNGLGCTTRNNNATPFGSGGDDDTYKCINDNAWSTFNDDVNGDPSAGGTKKCFVKLTGNTSYANYVGIRFAFDRPMNHIVLHPFRDITSGMSTYYAFFDSNGNQIGSRRYAGYLRARKELFFDTVVAREVRFYKRTDATNDKGRFLQEAEVYYVKGSGLDSYAANHIPRINFGSNLVPTTATVTNTMNTVENPGNLVDTSTYTYARAKNSFSYSSHSFNNPYIQIDIGSVVSADTVQVEERDDYVVRSEYDVFVSSNCSTWTRIGDHRDFRSSFTGRQTFMFTQRSVRCIRLYLMYSDYQNADTPFSRINWWGIDLRQIGLYDAKQTVSNVE